MTWTMGRMSGICVSTFSIKKARVKNVAGVKTEQTRSYLYHRFCQVRIIANTRLYVYSKLVIVQKTAKTTTAHPICYTQ